MIVQIWSAWRFVDLYNNRIGDIYKRKESDRFCVCRIPSTTTTENGEGGGMVALIVWFRYYYTIPRNCTRLLIFFFSLSLFSSCFYYFVFLFFYKSSHYHHQQQTSSLFSLSLSLSFGLINTQRERLCTHTHTVAKQTRNEQSRRGIGASICLVGLISVESGQLETLFSPFCGSFW